MSNFKTPKIRSEKHLRFVASQPCIVTGATEGVQAHHLLRAGGHGVSTTACDSLCIPLHHTIHDALHKNGNEIVFFANHGFDYEIIKDMAAYLSMKSPCKKVRGIYAD